MFRQSKPTFRGTFVWFCFDNVVCFWLILAFQIPAKRKQFKETPIKRLLKVKNRTLLPRLWKWISIRRLIIVQISILTVFLMFLFQLYYQCADARHKIYNFSTQWSWFRQWINRLDWLFCSVTCLHNKVNSSWEFSQSLKQSIRRNQNENLAWLIQMILLK